MWVQDLLDARATSFGLYANLTILPRVLSLNRLTPPGVSNGDIQGSKILPPPAINVSKQLENALGMSLVLLWKKIPRRLV